MMFLKIHKINAEAYLKMARIKRGRLLSLTVRRIQQLMKKSAKPQRPKSHGEEIERDTKINLGRG